MNYLAFYDHAPRIAMRDPLAALLGAAEDGLMEYRYVDAVHLAGHSCPTVAGAYLMARAAMRALYPDQPAERGGVTAQVLTLITGAAASNGFHGIGGRFVRQSLLSYAAVKGASAVQFHRRDNGDAVSVELDLSPVSPSPQLRELMGAALDPAVSAAQRTAFGHAWQDRVRRLLLEHADDPDVLQLTSLH